jgi:hypothetical protein
VGAEAVNAKLHEWLDRARELEASPEATEPTAGGQAPEVDAVLHEDAAARSAPDAGVEAPPTTASPAEVGGGAGLG